MPGLPVPMGSFIPCLLIGAISGRLFGELLDLSGAGASHAGTYAIVGSAAMLGGFTHMTLAIVVLLVEATRDLGLIPPLMLSIFVAHLVSKWMNPHAYDEHLIHKKGVAFLDAELPEELAGADAT